MPRDEHGNFWTACRICLKPATLIAWVVVDGDEDKAERDSYCGECLEGYLETGHVLPVPVRRIEQQHALTAVEVARWYLGKYTFGPCDVDDVDDVRAYRAGLATTQPLPAVSMAEMVGVR